MDIIMQARALGKSLQEDARYTRLINAAIASETDAELQSLIGRFNDIRTEINTEISKQDKDQDKLADLDKEFRQVYNSVLGSPVMKEYNEAKQEMETLLSHINTIIVGSSNGENPDEIDETAAMGCGGNCAGCAGCSN